MVARPTLRRAAAGMQPQSVRACPLSVSKYFNDIHMYVHIYMYAVFEFLHAHSIKQGVYISNTYGVQGVHLSIYPSQYQPFILSEFDLAY